KNCFATLFTSIIPLSIRGLSLSETWYSQEDLPCLTNISVFMCLFLPFFITIAIGSRTYPLLRSRPYRNGRTGGCNAPQIQVARQALRGQTYHFPIVIGL